MSLTKKKELQLILEERFPGKRFGVDKQENFVKVYYDAYLDEADVEELKILLEDYGIDATIERMVF